MRILVLGATPLAAWITARLRQSGQETTWYPGQVGDTAPALSPSLTIHHKDAVATASDLPLVDALVDGLDPKPDWLFFATPGWALGALAFEVISQLPPPDTPPSLCLTPGIGPTAKLVNYFGAENVVRGVVPARFLWGQPGDPQPDPTQLSLAGTPGLVVSQHALLKSPPAWYDSALWGGPLAVADDMRLKWSDLLWQLPGNALAAIMDRPPQAVYGEARLWAIEHRALREAVRVMDALDVTPLALPGVNVRRLAWWIRLLPGFLLRRVLGGYLHPSPLRTELHQQTGHSDAAYLNGAVAVAAQDLPFSTPANHALAVSVTDIAEGRASWAQFQAGPDDLETTVRIMTRH